MNGGCRLADENMYDEKQTFKNKIVLFYKKYLALNTK